MQQLILSMHRDLILESREFQSLQGDPPKPFHDGGRYHTETSPLICSANQWTSFYMITAPVMKGLTVYETYSKLTITI